MCQINDAQGEFPFWLMEILTEQDIIGVCHSKFQSVSLSIVHRPVVMLQGIESSVTPFSKSRSLLLPGFIFRI